MKAEKDRIIDHEIDGIQEYDNPIPMWMTVIFILCILFSIGYVPFYHVFHLAPLPAEAYAQEAEAAAVVRKAAEEKAAKADLTALISNTHAITEGRQIFQTYCVACHGEHAEGKIGPNLTDATWIHGGQIGDIIKTVTDGVPEKGMPAWGPVLGPDDVQEAAAFVYSLSAHSGSTESKAIPPPAQ